MWSLDGTNWHASGYTVEGLEPGVMQVRFSKAPPYYEPLPAMVEIKSGKTTRYGATYSVNNTKLEVTLYPEEIRDRKNARWSIDGFNWYRSGKCLEHVSAGNYTIQFKEVAEWTRPQD